MRITSLLLFGLVALSPAQDWIARYSSDPDTVDEARAVAVDRYGNSYVAGRSQGIALVKYSPSGESLWVRAHRTGGYSFVGSMAVQFDAAQNPIVAASVQRGTANGFCLLKYSASGDSQWCREHWHSSSLAPVQVDHPTMMYRAATGDLFIAGPGRTDSTEVDIVVYGLDASGGFKWMRYIDGQRHKFDVAYGITEVDAGHFCVAGYTTDASNHTDLTVLKFSTSGTLDWEYYYLPNTNYRSACWGIEPGPGDTVYAAGWLRSLVDAAYEQVIVALSGSGDTLWTARDTFATTNSYLKGDLAADAAGNVYLVFTLEDDGWTMCTRKYSSSGTKLWQREYRDIDSTQTFGLLAALADDQGVYACGYRWCLSSRSDFLVAKYRPDGQAVWSVFADTTVPYTDMPVSAACDPWGNLILTGESEYPTENYNGFLTMKFRSTGGIEEYGASPVPRTVLRVTPTVAAFDCQFELADAGLPTRLRIADLAGRTVAELPVTRPGTSARWNLTGPDGRVVPNGVYFAVVDLPGARATARFIIQW
ncbi:MAG: SBBP repeat-containing protein [Micromonosporaceae bacterium]|nr:SBBP repeat-containing protein [Micromonosporaceae bacterium]